MLRHVVACVLHTCIGEKKKLNQHLIEQVELRII